MRDYLTGKFNTFNFLQNSIHATYNFFKIRNHEVLQEKTRPVTRFIALGKVGNPKKLKWLYAFNIVPSVKMPAAKLNEQPAGATPSPFGVAIEEQEKSEERKVLLLLQFTLKLYLCLTLLFLGSYWESIFLRC